MKINKLCTLSQFVDVISETDKEHCNCYGNKELFKEAKKECVSMVVLIADKIINYNDFLKQKITEEIINKMFPDEPNLYFFVKNKGIIYLYELAEETKGELNINEIEI